MKTSLRLPADPPLTLDGHPVAQKIWQETAGRNVIQEIGGGCLLDYCLLCEQLGELESMLGSEFISSQSNLVLPLKQRIAEKKQLIAELRADLLLDNAEGG